jgi:hypothetical protein
LISTVFFGLLVWKARSLNYNGHESWNVIRPISCLRALR